MPHPEIQDLLGVFALDAVDPGEAATIEAHLATCPRCRNEVREHREVASLLAYAGTAAPAGLWDRLAATLDDAPPAVAAPIMQLGGRIAARHASGSRRRRGLGIASAVAAASLFVGVGAFGGLQVQSALRSQAAEIDRLRPIPADEIQARLLQEATSAALDAGARSVHLITPDKAPFADAVVLPNGTGYLLDKGAPNLSDGQIYQLWAVAGGQKLSLGVLGSDVGVVTFWAPESVDALALTVEESPGAVVSQNQAVGYGLVGRSSLSGVAQRE